MEKWKAIPGYEGLYEVSDIGRVKSLARQVPGRWGLRFVAERILRCAKARYTLATLAMGGSTKTYGVHRLVCEAFHGPAPEKAQAAHRDGDPHNNTVDNLYWATPVENCADRKRHGTWAHGTKVNTNKLSEAAVSEIKAICRRGASRKDVAAIYGVHRSTVDQLMRGDTWKHMEQSDAD